MLRAYLDAIFMLVSRRVTNKKRIKLETLWGKQFLCQLCIYVHYQVATYTMICVWSKCVKILDIKRQIGTN